MTLKHDPASLRKIKKAAREKLHRRDLIFDFERGHWYGFDHQTGEQWTVIENTGAIDFEQETPKPQSGFTRIEFAALCGQYGIFPSIALENDELSEALKAKDRAAVENILANQF